MRRKKEDPKLTVEQNHLKHLERKFGIIKSCLIDKVQKHDYHKILGELEEIKELFTLTVNELSN